MAQPISKVTGFKAVPDQKPVKAPAQPGFVRGTHVSAPLPSGSSVRASQDAEAKKIQALFVAVNPGMTHSTHTAQFMLDGKPATISGTKDDLTVGNGEFEMKIDHGELGAVTGLPGDLMRYRKLLEIDDALQKHIGLPGVWPAASRTAGR
jgi:hypothetical protein